MEVKDSNGTILSEGDSVKLIKDLKVRGTSTTLKRGTVVKNRRDWRKSRKDCYGIKNGFLAKDVV